jgi:hypothetical protein
MTAQRMKRGKCNFISSRSYDHRWWCCCCWRKHPIIYSVREVCVIQSLDSVLLMLFFPWLDCCSRVFSLPALTQFLFKSLSVASLMKRGKRDSMDRAISLSQGSFDSTSLRYNLLVGDIAVSTLIAIFNRCSVWLSKSCYFHIACCKAG